jgi:hypothetical protein
VSTQTRVSRDPRRDFMDDMPSTVVQAYLRSDAVDKVLDLIDRVLTEPDVLPARRTALSTAPDPLRQVPDAPVSEKASAPLASGEATAHLERCLRDIQGWLRVGLNDATRASGIDRGTVYAWRRRGSDPRPGTVGAVLRLRSLVASVVARAGEERAREWFHAGDPSPLTKLLAARGDVDAMATVARDARRAFAAPLPPPNPLLGSTVDDVPARPLT